MANAKCCDVCGRLYKLEDCPSKFFGSTAEMVLVPHNLKDIRYFGKLSISWIKPNNPMNMHDDMDLCPRCSERVLKLLDQLKPKVKNIKEVNECEIGEQEDQNGI